MGIFSMTFRIFFRAKFRFWSFWQMAKKWKLFWVHFREGKIARKNFSKNDRKSTKKKKIVFWPNLKKKVKKSTPQPFLLDFWPIFDPKTVFPKIHTSNNPP